MRTFAMIDYDDLREGDTIPAQIMEIYTWATVVDVEAGIVIAPHTKGLGWDSAQYSKKGFGLYEFWAYNKVHHMETMEKLGNNPQVYIKTQRKELQANIVAGCKS